MFTYVTQIRFSYPLTNIIQKGKNANALNKEQDENLRRLASFVARLNIIKQQDLNLLSSVKNTRKAMVVDSLVKNESVQFLGKDNVTFCEICYSTMISNIDLKRQKLTRKD